MPSAAEQRSLGCFQVDFLKKIGAEMHDSFLLYKEDNSTVSFKTTKTDEKSHL